MSAPTHDAKGVHLSLHILLVAGETPQEAFSCIYLQAVGQKKSSSCKPRQDHILLLQVLGVPRKADSDQIRRVYKKKLAEAKGNDLETKRIEDAHSSIMMSSFQSRLSVSLSIK